MSGPRKVVMVVPRLDVGGTERHLLRVLSALRGSDIDASLFVLARGGALEAAAAAAGVSIRGPAGAGWRYLRALRSGLALLRLLRRERPDIIHSFLPEAYLVGGVAAIAAGVPVRIMSRRSLAVYQEAHPLLARLERWLHRRTDILLGNSTAVVEQLVAECGERRKVGLIFNGIASHPGAADMRQAIRSALHIPPQALVLIVVANLIGYKGHGDLLGALAALGDRLPRPWRLLAVGRDDGIGAVLRRSAEDFGLADNVLWLGERTDTEQLLAAADISVVSSHQEGFSNSLIEAMSAGLPVVATAVGGNVDAVVEGETGLLVPPQSATALAAAILALAHDGERRRRMGACGRVRAQTMFSLDACVARYRALYRNAEEAARTGVQGVIDRADLSVAQDEAESLEHDPEKCEAVFGKDHAQTKDKRRV